MTTSTHSYYVTGVITGPFSNPNIGNCKTLTAAKTLAKKHGLSIIYVRVDNAFGGRPHMVMLSDSWEFITATEADFAKPLLGD